MLAIDFENDVNPVTADYVIDEIAHAEKDGYDAVVDPPGYARAVLPSRCATSTSACSRPAAGDRLRLARRRAGCVGRRLDRAGSGRAAMAPQTNIGSSTPISVGGENIPKDLRRKVVNDAAASLEALAESHGRNVRVGRAGRASGLEPDRERGARAGRHRLRGARSAGTAERDRRADDEGAEGHRPRYRGRRGHDRRDVALGPHPRHDHRPEHHRSCSRSGCSRSPSSSSTRA